MCEGREAIANAHETARHFERWWTGPTRRGLPIALVAQDGLEHMERWLTLAWPRIDALFIGGTTTWKLGPAARALVREAQRHGLWVHMGRVNSLKRISYAAEIGCDSIDGTGWMRWRNIRLPEGLQAVSAPPRCALPGLERDSPSDTPHSQDHLLPSGPALRVTARPSQRAVHEPIHQQLALDELERWAA
jgi:hypothetical protein